MDIQHSRVCQSPQGAMGILGLHHVWGGKGCGGNPGLVHPQKRALAIAAARERTGMEGMWGGHDGMTKGDAQTFIIAVSPLPAPGLSPRARCARRESEGGGGAAQLCGTARLLPGETPAAGSAPTNTSEFADSGKLDAEGTCGAEGGALSARVGDDEMSSNVSRARAIARNALRRGRVRQKP